MKGGGLFMAWLQEANAKIQPNLEHERLGDIFQSVDKAKNTLAETAFGFAQAGKADPEAALLSATPFLEMFGQIEVARILASQARLADEKLQLIISEKNVSDDEGLKKLLSEHTDARFYDGKIKTARFFASTVLPHARALAVEIKNADSSALDIEF